ncbi:MAG: CDP-alcohol phosphatidyltransferase family protein [Pseudomonadota bacterium]
MVASDRSNPGTSSSETSAETTAAIQRRPLAARRLRLAQASAAWLSRAGIAPNMISIAGLIAAVVAGGLLWAGGEAVRAMAGGGAGAAPGTDFLTALALLLGAGFVALRLAANLLDGLVAVEGGKGAPDGAFWNEVPDRFADLAILAGLGLGAGLPALGLAAGALAVLTAYLREFGVAQGLAPDFGGPFAKPQRMGATIATALLAAALVLLLPAAAAPVLAAGLWLIALGTGATVLRRAYRLRAALAKRG